jgi:hypothetical protein
LIGLSLALASMLGIYFLLKPFGVWVEVIGLAVAGLGVGFYGQFTVTLAQAFSESKFLGSVTSTVIVSRDMGSSIVATFAGGLFGYGVSSALAKLPLPGNLQGVSLQPSDLMGLPEGLKLQVQQAYVDAFLPVFLNSAVTYLLILVLAISMPKVSLKAK